MPIEVEQMTSRTAMAAQAAKREAAAANDAEPGTAEETEVRSTVGTCRTLVCTTHAKYVLSATPRALPHSMLHSRNT